MKNILLEYSPIIRLLMSYQWLLRALANCETQYKMISRQIDEGSAAEDVVDPDWKNKISAEAKNIRNKLRLAQQIVADIPGFSRTFAVQIVPEKSLYSRNEPYKHGSRHGCQHFNHP